MVPPAIQTEYAGCRFRSRLEARWAVFFDVMGETWQYEPEGFELDGTRYLPDFYLPRIETYVEVKGVLDEEGARKIVKLANSRAGAVMVVGDIPDPGSAGPNHTYVCQWRNMSETLVFGAEWIPRDTAPQGVNPWLHGFPSIASAAEPLGNQGTWQAPRQDVVLDGEVRDAYRAARSARFEYGEQGAPKIPEMAH